MRRLGKILLFLVLGAFLLLVACNIWVVYSTAAQVYDDQSDLPVHRIGLVLGTSPRTVYFETRMNTAGKLFREGKIDHFILSGDNRSVEYNEPMKMKKALLGRGVPETAITLDYAGLRTLDSIVRCKQIFGQDKVTIITQPFHSYRALFISKFYDIDAVAMVADEPDFEQSVKVRLREYLARPIAVLDLYVLKTAPRYMGQKEELNVSY